jgi:hypothetical protein
LIEAPSAVKASAAVCHFRVIVPDCRSPDEAMSAFTRVDALRRKSGMALRGRSASVSIRVRV